MRVNVSTESAILRTLHVTCCTSSHINSVGRRQLLPDQTRAALALPTIFWAGACVIPAEPATSSYHTTVIILPNARELGIVTTAIERVTSGYWTLNVES